MKCRFQTAAKGRFSRSFLFSVCVCVFMCLCVCSMCFFFSIVVLFFPFNVLCMPCILNLSI